MNTLIDCINDPSKKIDGELKRKILAEAAMGKKLKDANYIPSEEEVVEALQKIQKRNNRERIERANDIVKLQTNLQEIEYWKKTMPNTSRLAYKYLMSSLDRDIWGTFKGKQSGAGDLQFRYLKERENLLAPSLIYYEQLNKRSKEDFMDIVGNIKDNTTENNSVYPQDMIRQAEQFVKVYDEYMDMKIADMNEAGIIIHPIEGYNFETTHSQEYLSSITAEEYVDRNINRIDWDRTETPNGDKLKSESERAEFLVKFRQSIIDRGSDPFKTSGGKAIPRNALDQHRLMHFNTWKDAMGYKKDFSESKDLMEDLTLSIIRESAMYGVSRKFGSNPEKNLDILLKHLRNSDELSETQKVNVEELFLFKTGQTNEISNPILWNLFRGIKNLTYSGIMGSVFVTSYSGDNAAIARALKRSGLDKNMLPILGALGKTHFKTTKQFMTNYGKLIKQDPEAKSALLKNITAIDGVMGMQMVMKRFDENNNGFADNYTKVPEKGQAILKATDNFAKAGEFLSNAVFKYTGQIRLQRTMKDMVGQTYIIGMNNAKKYNLDELKKKEPVFYDWVVNEANFTPDQWERFRNSKEGDMTISDIRKFDSDLRDAFWKGMHSIQTLAIQEPSDIVKSQKHRYSLSKKKDSIGAMLMDSLLMLKGFVIQAVPNLTKRIRTGNRQGGIVGGAMETTSLFLTLTISGMMMESMKALINGTTPPDYTDLDFLGKNLISLLSVSGGLGIISDILFYDYSKYGGGFGEVLGGPLLGNLAEGGKIAGEAIQAPFREDIDVPIYDAVQYFHSLLPFNNYLFTKQLTNTLIKDNLLRLSDSERFEKGLKTQETRLEEQRGQERIDYSKLFD